MRLDSHQHFWRYNPTDYVWMSEAMGVLRRDYLPPDLEPQLERIGFDGSICVQARQLEEETDWLLQLADENRFIRGVVGWVDFTSPQLDETLERFAANSKLKGVRELIHDMPDMDYAVCDIHTRAISKLGPLGLTYDLLLKPQHLKPAASLVRQFPDQFFVVDHIAKPNIREAVIEPWRTDLTALAKCENVYCKLSGMVTEAAWGEWVAATFRPYLESVLDLFGNQRVMIGSDWPVCTLSGSYAATMQIVIDFTNELTVAERNDVLGSNAARFYGVEESIVKQCAVIN